MVVLGLDQAEQLLLGGELTCPHPRPRLDQADATARARSGSCTRTQILLPASLVIRPADNTEAIVNARFAKAPVAGP